MRLLLDTHALVWAGRDPVRLPAQVRDLLVDGTTDVAVSVVTAWEVSVKRRLGKLDFAPMTERRLREFRFRALPVALAHALATEQLPLLHRDPFDRMLVAQARVEGLVLVTGDRAVRQYDVETLWD